MGFERAAAVIGIQAGDDDTFAEIRKLGANIDYLIAKECASSMPITSVRGDNFSRISAALKMLSEGMPRPECDTISLAA